MGALICLVLLLLPFYSFPKWMRLKHGKKVRWSCEKCGKQFREGYMVEFHHKIPTSSGGKDTFKNMELLCMACHLAEHERLAATGEGHPRSPDIIRARLMRTGGRTSKWLKENT